MSATGTIERATARILVVTQDGGVKKLLDNLMLHNRIRAGVTESTWNASRFMIANPAPDLLIVDLDLPESQTLEFLKQVRGHADFTKLPVLVLTAVPDPEQVRQALDAGADRYLTKMFMGKNLLTTIQEMLSQASV